MGIGNGEGPTRQDPFEAGFGQNQPHATRGHCDHKIDIDAV
jgi:hypothetical protein